MARAIIVRGATGSVTNFGVVFEGDSIVASKPPSASTTSFAWRFAAEYTPTPLVDVPAVSGTNMTDLEWRFMHVVGSNPSVLSLIQAMLPNVDILIYYIQMGNGLIEMQPDVLWTHTRAMLEQVKAIDPAKIYVVTADHLFRNNETFAPGFAAGNGAVTNEFNAFPRARPWRMDEHIPFTDTLVFADCLDLAKFLDGIHQTDSTNINVMLPMTKTYVNKILNLARPRNTTIPNVTGSPVQASTLTVAPGAWSPGGSRGYQWVLNPDADDAVIASQTGLTYIPVSGDVGSTIACAESCTAGGITQWKISNTVGPITGPAGSFGDLVDEDFTLYTVKDLAASASLGPGTGPVGGCGEEYTIVLPNATYLYKQHWVSSGIPAGVTDGQPLRVKFAVKGVSGEKIAIGMSSGNGSAPHGFVLHAFDGGWQTVELLHTPATVDGMLLGFERRSFVFPGVIGSSNFLASGVKYSAS